MRRPEIRVNREVLREKFSFAHLFPPFFSHQNSPFASLSTCSAKGPKGPRLHSKTTISTPKLPSVDQKHPFFDQQKTITQQKTRPFLPISQAKQQNNIKDCPGA